MADIVLIQHARSGEQYMIEIGDGDFDDDPDLREEITNAPDGEYVNAYVDLSTATRTSEEA